MVLYSIGEPCPHCQASRQVTVYGCDWCEATIKSKYPLLLTAYSDDGLDDIPSDYHYCCWECLFLGLQVNVKCNHYVALPHLCFTEGTPGRAVTAFWDAIGSIRRMILPNSRKGEEVP